jgi:hypothetical protein
MANFVYKKAKEAMLSGDVDLVSNNLKLLLASSSYSPNQNTDNFVSNINSSHIKARSAIFSGVTISAGILDANDVVVSNYPGDAFNAVVIYQDSGSDQTSILIAYIDTSEGLPFSGVNTNTNITIAWSNTLNKILSL